MHLGMMKIGVFDEFADCGVREGKWYSKCPKECGIDFVFKFEFGGM